MSVSRREFLKISGSVAAGTGAAVLPGFAGAAPTQDAGSTVLPYPRKTVAVASELEEGQAVVFHYPDDSSPCALIKMGRPVPGGVGPNRDIVAFSTLCTHMGCPAIYDQGTRTFRCGCHYSVFDAEMAGQMVCGQATENLPQVVLEYGGDGDLSATAIKGLIYGRQSNIL